LGHRGPDRERMNMANFNPPTYRAADFSHLKDLNGLSDQQIEQHLELYAGYVQNTNQLNARLAELANAGQAGTPEHTDLLRRRGFEYDGMILHEYYFGNLRPNGSGEPRGESELLAAMERDFGSFDGWKQVFGQVARMRGVGWAILYQDPHTGQMSNHWISLHQDGHPAGFKPLLVMDVWEHAFMVDYKATERAKYIDAFFSNIDWSVVEHRLRNPSAERLAA
jgi:Fe-Mn family superoxide dismutase